MEFNERNDNWELKKVDRELESRLENTIANDDDYFDPNEFYNDELPSWSIGDYG